MYKMAFRQSLIQGIIKHIRTYSRNSSGNGRDNTSSSNSHLRRCGDEESSSTIEGAVLPNDNVRYNAIGAAEELLSHLGLARQHAIDSKQQYCDQLIRVQPCIIEITNAISKSNRSKLSCIQTKQLEKWIDKYTQQLPPLEKYIIPGGSLASASLHVARAICRKTEREVAPLVRNGTLDKEVQVYLNRLSDFLLVAARIAAKQNKRSEKVNIRKRNTTPVQK